MRRTTFIHIKKQMARNHIMSSQLPVTFSQQHDTVWEIEVVYNGKDDEMIYCGETLYEVNLVDWIADNVCTEATIEGQIDSEPHWWSVRLRKINTDELVYEQTEDTHPPMTCSCGELVTGHDGFCSACRAKLHKIERDLEKKPGDDLPDEHVYSAFSGG